LKLVLADISAWHRQQGCIGAAFTPKRDRYIGRSRPNARFTSILTDIPSIPSVPDAARPRPAAEIH